MLCFLLCNMVYIRHMYGTSIGTLGYSWTEKMAESNGKHMLAALDSVNQLLPMQFACNLALEKLVFSSTVCMQYFKGKTALSHAACMQHSMGTIWLCPMLFACSLNWESQPSHAVCLLATLQGQIGLCHRPYEGATLHWKGGCWGPANMHAPHGMAIHSCIPLCFPSTLTRENCCLTHATV